MPASVFMNAGVGKQRYRGAQRKPTALELNLKENTLCEGVSFAVCAGVQRSDCSCTFPAVVYKALPY